MSSPQHFYGSLSSGRAVSPPPESRSDERRAASPQSHQLEQDLDAARQMSKARGNDPSPPRGSFSDDQAEPYFHEGINRSPAAVPVRTPAPPSSAIAARFYQHNRNGSNTSLDSQHHYIDHRHQAHSLSNVHSPSALRARSSLSRTPMRSPNAYFPSSRTTEHALIDDDEEDVGGESSHISRGPSMREATATSLAPSTRTISCTSTTTTTNRPASSVVAPAPKTTSASPCTTRTHPRAVRTSLVPSSCTPTFVMPTTHDPTTVRCRSAIHSRLTSTPSRSLPRRNATASASRRRTTQPLRPTRCFVNAARLHRSLPAQATASRRTVMTPRSTAAGRASSAPRQVRLAAASTSASLRSSKAAEAHRLPWRARLRPTASWVAPHSSRARQSAPSTSTPRCSTTTRSHPTTAAPTRLRASTLPSPRAASDPPRQVQRHRRAPGRRRARTATEKSRTVSRSTRTPYRRPSTHATSRSSPPMDRPSRSSSVAAARAATTRLPPRAARAATPAVHPRSTPRRRAWRRSARRLVAWRAPPHRPRAPTRPSTRARRRRGP